MPAPAQFHVDPGGDQGRYGTTLNQRVSLEAVCCASRERMELNLEMWVSLVEANVRWPAAAELPIDESASGGV